MKWTGKNVLVTGAGGFIGSHLVNLLAEQGAIVRAFVRYNSRGTFGWLPDLPPDVFRGLGIVQGDLRDADTVMQAVKGCDFVFHLGAMISIPYSYVNPTEAIAINVGGTLNVLNACRHWGVERLIHVSTSEIYGTAQYVPIDEKHPTQGQSPYSASKIAADKLAESYFRAFDLPVATIRPFNTYGPRQSARALIPAIIVQMLAGPEVRLGALKPTRDFTFVTDTAEGMMRAAESGAAVGREINLGSGREIEVGELAGLIAKIIGKPLNIVQQQARIRPAKSEVDRLLSDNQLAAELIDWRPTVGFEDGLKQTVDWIRANLSEYQRAREDYVI
jgi:dTDP-glucose 4,6-dehydratase